MPTINIDMDGVIYNYVDALIKFAHSPIGRERFNLNYTEIRNNPDDWHFTNQWGLKDKAQLWRFLYAAINEGVFLSGSPIPGAIDTIQTFIDDGHRIRLVTAKNFNDAAITAKAQADVIFWLNKHAAWYPDVELAFTNNKQGYEADIVIDDKPSLGWAQLNKVNILFGQPWNAGINADPHTLYPIEPNLYRTTSWQQVQELVREVANSGAQTMDDFKARL